MKDHCQEYRPAAHRHQQEWLPRRRRRSRRDIRLRLLRRLPSRQTLPSCPGGAIGLKCRSYKEIIGAYRDTLLW